MFTEVDEAGDLGHHHVGFRVLLDRYGKTGPHRSKQICKIHVHVEALEHVLQRGIKILEKDLLLFINAPGQHVLRRRVHQSIMKLSQFVN